MQLHTLTATEAARMIRNGDLSPVEYTQALVDQIEKTEPQIKAWESIDTEAALATAKALEEKRSAKFPTQPLFGVPFGIKDLLHARGFPTCGNFKPWSEKIQMEDSGVAQFLREAGGILVGKQVTTQWGTVDPPPTRNPWGLDRTPGGSSSGGGAAVGARQVPFGIGTQAVGSNNRPAAYCGVMAIKPTFGRISRYGAVGGSWTQGHPGVIARSVADLALVLGVLARHDPRDPFSAVQKQEDFVGAVHAPQVPRLAVISDLMERSDPSVRTSAERSINRLREAGAEICEVKLPVSLDILASTHGILGAGDRATAHLELHAQHAEHYAPIVRAGLEAGQLIPAPVYLHAARLRRRFRAQMLDLFSDGIHGLIAPTASNLPPDPSTTGDPTFQVPGTMFGFPIVSLPTEVGSEGLPHAVQIVARPFEDKALLSYAAWCERVFDPISMPPHC
jgi:aspartyl-tRNA(Asn)/glutamyl-tRNA(Gln) amidotransferase subunit A